MTIVGLKFKQQSFRRPSWEKNDCAVRALASARKLPYVVAHSVLDRAGRTIAEGTSKMTMEHAIIPLGFIPVECNLLHQRFRTVAEHIKTGRWIVGTSDHFFAVVQGVIHDRAADLVGPGTKITELYYFAE